MGEKEEGAKWRAVWLPLCFFLFSFFMMMDGSGVWVFGAGKGREGER